MYNATNIMVETTPPDKSHVPGEPAYWLLIFGDMVVFSLMFGIFMYYRSDNPDLFNRASSLLNNRIGLINTMLLLTGSLAAAIGLKAVRHGRIVGARRAFVAAAISGVGFGLFKMVEYHEQVASGHTILTNMYYMLYYSFTMIHLIHVALGVAMLNVLVVMLGRDQRSGQRKTSIPLAEGICVYWHMVDFLWVVLYPLFYLVR